MIAETAPRGFEHTITPPDQEALGWLVKRVSGVAMQAPDVTADPIRGITWHGAANPEELLPQRLAMDVGGEATRGAVIEATRVVNPRTGSIAKRGIVAEVGVGFLLDNGKSRKIEYSVGYQPDMAGEEYTIEATGAASEVVAPPHTIIPMLGRAGLDEYVDRQLRFFDQARAFRRLLGRDRRRVTAQEVGALNKLFSARLEN